MKIGVIGVGNMGGSILKGLAHHFDSKELYAENHVNPRVSELQKKLGFHLVNEITELPKDLDILIATVPASITKDVLSELKVSNKTIIASAAGGVRIADVQDAVGNRPVLAMVPNIPVAVNAGTIGLSYGSLTPDQQTVVDEVIGSLGDLIVVKEAQLPIVGTIGGCGPAFVDVFMSAMADGAVENGLDRKTAYKTISSMVKGSGRLAQLSDLSPADLKDQVTSPGGTTIKGVNQLAANQFQSAIIKAINAANGDM